MKKLYFLPPAIIGIIVVIYLALWGSIVFSNDPLHHPLSKWPLWVVACNTRGCVTTSAWNTQHTLAQQFAIATKQDAPTPEATLTTSIRKHLVNHALLRSPVKLTDVRRYREDILNITSESDLQSYITTTLAEYDETVLLPFLQQEALKTQQKVESIDELYKLLNEQHPVFLFLRQYRWDKEAGKIVTR